MSDDEKKRPDHYFKPGQSGNPAGRPPASPEEKALKKLSRHKLQALINELIHMSVQQLEAISKDRENTTVGKMMLAAVMARAITQGDHKRLDFVLDRLIGKVPQKFESADGEPITFIGLVQAATKEHK